MNLTAIGELYKMLLLRHCNHFGNMARQLGVLWSFKDNTFVIRYFLIVIILSTVLLDWLYHTLEVNNLSAHWPLLCRLRYAEATYRDHYLSSGVGVTK